MVRSGSLALAFIGQIPAGGARALRRNEVAAPASSDASFGDVASARFRGIGVRGWRSHSPKSERWRRADGACLPRLRARPPVDYVAPPGAEDSRARAQEDLLQPRGVSAATRSEDLQGPGGRGGKQDVQCHKRGHFEIALQLPFARILVSTGRSASHNGPSVGRPFSSCARARVWRVSGPRSPGHL
jgi:hypothetical protein